MVVRLDYISVSCRFSHGFLVFLTGQDEIQKAVKMVNDAGVERPGRILALQLFASLMPHMQQRVFEKTPPVFLFFFLLSKLLEYSKSDIFYERSRNLPYDTGY